MSTEASVTELSAYRIQHELIVFDEGIRRHNTSVPEAIHDVSARTKAHLRWFGAVCPDNVGSIIVCGQEADNT